MIKKSGTQIDQLLLSAKMFWLKKTDKGRLPIMNAVTNNLVEKLQSGQDEM